MKYIVYALIACIIIIMVLWNISPWLLAFVAVVILIFVIIAIKRKKDNEEYYDDEETSQPRTSLSYGEIEYSFPTKVVGVTFNGIQKLLPTLSAGMHLDMKREPNNPHDSNAVAVMRGDACIGHLKADVAADIAPLMDSGVKVTGKILQITGGNGYNYGCNIMVEIYKK